jgi:two-component system, sporulation sensor kinase E
MRSQAKLTAVTITGFITIVIGFLVIIGWIFHIPFFQTIMPNYISMKFNTALLFVLLGGLLLFSQLPVQKHRIVVPFFLSLTITVIGSVSLLQTLFNFNCGLDQLFVTDITSITNHAPYPGRMSVHTAICFVFCGLAFLGFSHNSNIVHIISQYLLNMVTAIAAIAIIGYLYGLSLFYGISYTGSMAVHTAVLLFFISLTASLIHPTIGITMLFTGNRVGNRAARQLFFLAIFIIVIFGALRIASHRFGLFSFTNGVSILVICFICVALALLWHMVNWMNRLDNSRHNAEEEVNLAKEKLEKRVKERSAKLMDLLVKFRESETKFKAAFEHSAIGVALVSLKGKWLQVNKRFCDMVGYKEQELLSMSFEDITYPDDLANSRNLADKMIKGGNQANRIEKRYVCKNGSIVWISVNMATVTNKKGGPLYFVSQFEDITERKKAEARLKTAYAEIKNHVGNIQDIAWKQSHLIRKPLANLKGLTALLLDNPSDSEILKLMQEELNRLDNVIIEMAEDASGSGLKLITLKKRSFRAAV